MKTFGLHILAFLVVFVWGSTFISTKLLLDNGFSPSQIFFVRFLLGYLCLVALSFRKADSRRLFCESWKDELLMFVAALTGGSFFFVIENSALIYTQTAIVSFITTIAPLITVFFAFLLPGAKNPQARLWWGSAIAIVGVYFVVISGQHISTADGYLWGSFLAAASAVIWAVYQLICEPLGKKYGAIFLTRKVFGYGVITVLPIIFHEGAMDAEAFLKPVVWGNFLYLSIVASFLGFLIWSFVIKGLGGVVSSNYLYVNPVATCICSYLILDERITMEMMVGGALIFLGIFIAIREKKKKEQYE